MSAPLPAGATIGIIGGGQLGRMLAMAAARLGYRTIILEPQADCPAAQVANRQIVAAYDDPAALAELARACDVVTYEFENVPVAAARAACRERCRSTRRRARWKSPRTGWPKSASSTSRHIHSRASAPSTATPTSPRRSTRFGGSGVLKTRRLGYDGKGQRVFRDATATTPPAPIAAMGGVPLILEALRAVRARDLGHRRARGRRRASRPTIPAENVHRDGILHSSTVPAAHLAGRPPTRRATPPSRILEALDYVGVIGVEFFVLADGALLANEIAPRVHNSGHWTEAACAVSQFEQHIRAIAGLPLGDTGRHSDCVMENLIGDDVVRAPALLAEPDLVLHLYGKAEARPGRKMGHFTRLKRRKHGGFAGRTVDSGRPPRL